ncbi:hypothetical protein LX36DRAFT_688628 [Colletotrichum falcatum]|nr:hypothetical protein LX36DRAFT_688628 [Colletotrichum falcatum]
MLDYQLLHPAGLCHWPTFMMQPIGQALAELRIVTGSGAVSPLLAIIFCFFLSFDCGLYSLGVRNKPGIALRKTQRVYTDYATGTAATWFFLDVSFCGLGLDNRGTLSDMWATTGPTPIDDRLPCEANLLTVSLASIAGSACFVMIANRIPHRLWLTLSFLGCVYCGVNRTSGAPATVRYVISWAKTLTFIIPTEIFPTCYRCTCHGISAAAGKLGSIVALFVVYRTNSPYKAENRQQWVVDEYGRHVLEQKTLEGLGESRERRRQPGGIITIKEKWHGLKRKRTSPVPSQAAGS